MERTASISTSAPARCWGLVGIRPPHRPPTFHSRWFVDLYGTSALFRRVAFRFATQAVLRNTAQLWRVGYDADRDDWLFDAELLDRWARRGLELMKLNILRIREYLEARSIPLLVLLYPSPMELQRQEPSNYERELRQFLQQRGSASRTPTLRSAGSKNGNRISSGATFTGRRRPPGSRTVTALRARRHGAAHG